MIRIICAETDANFSGHVGGPPSVLHRTFEVDLPEVELWLKDANNNAYLNRSFVGIEIIWEAKP